MGEKQRPILKYYDAKWYSDPMFPKFTVSLRKVLLGVNMINN